MFATEAVIESPICRADLSPDDMNLPWRYRARDISRRHIAYRMSRQCERRLMVPSIFYL